jgi:hypothetical protein
MAVAECSFEEQRLRLKHGGGRVDDLPQDGNERLCWSAIVVSREFCLFMQAKPARSKRNAALVTP